MDNKDRRLIRIQPTAMYGGPHKGITFEFILMYDEHTRRKVTIKGKWSDWDFKTPWYPQRMQSIMMNVMTRSEVPFRMTLSEFLNFELKRFNRIEVTDELLLD